jgi:hypothetical protein
LSITSSLLKSTYPFLRSFQPIPVIIALSTSTIQFFLRSIGSLGISISLTSGFSISNFNLSLFFSSGFATNHSTGLAFSGLNNRTSSIIFFSSSFLFSFMTSAVIQTVSTSFFVVHSSFIKSEVADSIAIPLNLCTPDKSSPNPFS